MKILLLLVMSPWVICHSLEETCKTTDKNCHPEQIHIAFGENVNAMTITWSTMKDTNESVAQFGEKTTDTTVTGKNTVFVDGGPQKRQQWIHRVALKDLKYNTKYVYKVGSKYGWSDQFSFTTPADGQNYSISAIIYGDMGNVGDHSSKSVLKDITNSRFDLVIHNGDYAYDLGSDNARNGDNFMNMIQNIAANIPYMTSPGNHEGGYNFSNYKNRFSMPGDTESMFFSYDVGPVHFVAINTEVYYGWHMEPRDHSGVSASGGKVKATKAEVQTHYNWLKADLEEANKKENRDKKPWIIMYGHRPMYCTVQYDHCRVGGKDGLLTRVGIPEFGGLGMEPLLKDYGVDLVFWAHEHNYERTFPLYDEKVYNGSYEQPYTNPRAPVHITTGAAGNREPQTDFIDPFAWSAFRSSDYSYMRMFVHNHTHINLECISTNDPDKPKKIDEILLIKNEHKPYDL